MPICPHQRTSIDNLLLKFSKATIRILLWSKYFKLPGIIPDKTKSYNQKFFTLASQFIQIISALVYRTLLIQKLLCPYSRFAPGNLLYDVNVSCSLSPCFKCMRYPAQTTEKDGLKARKACKRYCSLK